MNEKTQDREPKFLTQNKKNKKITSKIKIPHYIKNKRLQSQEAPKGTNRAGSKSPQAGGILGGTISWSGAAGRPQIVYQRVRECQPVLGRRKHVERLQAALNRTLPFLPISCDSFFMFNTYSG